MVHYVYVLRSKKDKKRYIGISDDVVRRINEHNRGKVVSTRNRRPLTLEYKESYANRVLARNREKYFKTAVGRRFLNKINSARVVKLADTAV